jgi:cytidylate kinase
MGMMASAVSKSPAVRSRLLSLQRKLGEHGGVVMDGRDIGTVVFPNADLKVFLDASCEERGRRRYRELREKGLDVDLATITEEIRTRDAQDSSREIAPLRRAPDAVSVDSSTMTIEEVVNAMLNAVAAKR